MKYGIGIGAIYLAVGVLLVHLTVKDLAVATALGFPVGVGSLYADLWTAEKVGLL